MGGGGGTGLKGGDSRSKLDERGCTKGSRHRGMEEVKGEERRKGRSSTGQVKRVSTSN